jgi:hypothetical protein
VRLQALLVLDTHRDSSCAADEGQEWAIRLAAGVGCGLLDHGADVTAVLAGRLVRLPGVDPRRTLLDLLAQLEADDCPPLEQLLSLSALRRFTGHRQIVVTSAAARDRLPQPVRSDRRRRYVVVEDRRAGGVSLPVVPWMEHRTRFVLDTESGPTGRLTPPARL